MAGTLVRTDFTRVFTQAGRAGPGNVPTYQGLAMAAEVAWKQGDIKLVRIPDPKRYGGFLTVGEIPGDQAQPNIKTSWKYTKEKSACLQFVQQGCPLDLQIHIGECQDPRDFDAGWDKVLILENARITDYATDKLGALNPAERAEALEAIPFDGQDLYEVLPMAFQEQAKATILNEIVDITVCDLVSCGDCGTSSDGCQTLFAVSNAVTGSPGLSSQVLYTTTGGSTWAATHNTALPANKDPNACACVGHNLVVLSSGDVSITYAATANILAGTDTWVRVATGLNVSGGPVQIWSDGPNLTWMVGLGGYIYFTSDPTSGVSVQDAGIATTQNLNDIYGLGDGINLVAVGANNAVVVTSNGGVTWASVTGPNVGVALNCVAMRSQFEWWVGDASGKLWYTLNAGQTWTQKPIPNQAIVTSINDIQFGYNDIHQTIGFMAVNTASVGMVYRTIDGGYSWYAQPEQGGVMPTIKKLDVLAPCANQNVIYGAGVLTGTTGTIIKGA